MHLVNIIGTIALISSFFITMVGFPAQAMKNYKEKKVGLSSMIIFSSVTVYWLWAIYGWLKPDWFLAVAQTIGGITSTVVMFQYFYYRKPKTPA